MEKKLTPGMIGTLKVGSKVIVDGTDMQCNPCKVAMTVVKNGIDTVLKGKDNVSVKVDGSDWNFHIDLPRTRKNLNCKIH